MLALRNKLKGLNFIRLLQHKQDSSGILNALYHQDNLVIVRKTTFLKFLYFFVSNVNQLSVPFSVLFFVGRGQIEPRALARQHSTNRALSPASRKTTFFETGSH